MEVRSDLRLDASEAALEQAVRSDIDGDALFGIPLTPEEVDELLERAEFVHQVYEKVISVVEDNPQFGGAYVDLAEGGGEVVVGLVDATRREVRELESRVSDPNGSRRLRIVSVAHSEHELRQAAHEVWALWESEFPDAELYEVEVDVRSQSLIAHLEPESVAIVRESIPDSTLAALAPPLVAMPGERAFEECTPQLSRDNCTSPMRAGNLVRRGSTGGERCTMGWHVAPTFSSRSFLSAGHCSYGSSRSNNWFHQGWSGQLGTVQRNLYGPTDPNATSVDAMRVSMPSNQASRRIYSESRQVNSYRNPLLGETVCASLGRSNSVRCGTVSTTYTTWIGEACECLNVGARGTYSPSQRGDSGSPVYVRTSSSAVTAVGIHNRTNSSFARMGQTMSQMGISNLAP